MELEQIGKYKILDKIGQGSMGVVYKAQDPVLNRNVAIKMISASLDKESDARKRFLREAQSAARLNHPNIVTVFDFGEEQGRIYMAMELLEGRDLKQLIANRTLTHLEERLRVMEQICDGLAFAHSKDVVHRDLKPANIHVQPSGDVKIMDFGLARLGTSEMTATGTVMGTPNYMSPEQVRGQKADARSDIFSLGAVFYELLTYHKAFDAESLHAILFQVLESEPESPRQWVPELPEILVQIVEKALAKDPTERFRHAGELREALRIAAQVLTGELDEEAGIAAVVEPSAGEATIIDTSGSEPTLIAPPGTEPPSPAATKDGSRRGATLARARTLTTAKGGTAMGSRAARTAFPARSRVQPVPAPKSAPPPPASRLPLYLGGGVLLAVVAAVAVYMAMRPGRPSGGTPSAGKDLSREQVGALTDALVVSQVELARENLKDKNYEEALAQAERALKLDPNSSDAKQVLERTQGILKELEAAATEARTAFKAGDPEKATQALSKVLAINPNHPVAAELAAQLNRYFRVQAEEAKRAMADSRAAAEKAKAGSQKSFDEASAAFREADALLGKGQFAVATRKFFDARDGFERARRAAEALAQAQAEQLARATRPPTVAPVTAPPLTAAPVTAAPPPSLPPVAVTPAAVARPTLPPAAGAGSEEPAIRKVIEDYGRAIQAKDLALLKAVKPNLSAEDEKRFRDIFKAYKSYLVNISVDLIQLDGNQARLRLSRRDTIDGKPVSFQQTWVLVKGPGGWTIRDIGQ